MRSVALSIPQDSFALILNFFLVAQKTTSKEVMLFLAPALALHLDPVLLEQELARAFLSKKNTARAVLGASRGELLVVHKDHEVHEGFFKKTCNYQPIKLSVHANPIRFPYAADALPSSAHPMINGSNVAGFPCTCTDRLFAKLNTLLNSYKNVSS